MAIAGILQITFMMFPPKMVTGCSFADTAVRELEN
jgi:hypothetical protein